MLQGVLLGPWAAAVAAAAAREDQQLGGAEVAGAALGAPPSLDVVDGEAEGVGGIADADGAQVGVR